MKDSTLVFMESESRLSVDSRDDSRRPSRGTLDSTDNCILSIFFFFQSALQILRVMDEELQLQYIDEVKQNVYKWPTVPDISVEPIEHVIQTLPYPDLVEELSSSRRQCFTFNKE